MQHCQIAVRTGWNWQAVLLELILPMSLTRCRYMKNFPQSSRMLNAMSSNHNNREKNSRRQEISNWTLYLPNRKQPQHASYPGCAEKPKRIARRAAATMCRGSWQRTRPHSSRSSRNTASGSPDTSSPMRTQICATSSAVMGGPAAHMATTEAAAAAAKVQIKFERASGPHAKPARQVRHRPTYADVHGPTIKAQKQSTCTAWPQGGTSARPPAAQGAKQTPHAPSGSIQHRAVVISIESADSSSLGAPCLRPDVRLTKRCNTERKRGLAAQPPLLAPRRASSNSMPPMRLRSQTPRPQRSNRSCRVSTAEFVIFSSTASEHENASLYISKDAAGMRDVILRRRSRA